MSMYQNAISSSSYLLPLPTSYNPPTLADSLPMTFCAANFPRSKDGFNDLFDSVVMSDRGKEGGAGFSHKGCVAAHYV